MQIPIILYWLLGLSSIFYFLIFAYYSFTENKLRTVILSSLVIVILQTIFSFPVILFHPGVNYYLFADIIIIFLAGIFFLPYGKKSAIKSNPTGEKFDERDIMFARADYQPGTDKYKEYYEMRPEHKESDDKFRKLPRLLSEGGKYFEPERSRYVRSLFEIEEKAVTFVDGEIAEYKTDISKEHLTAIVKEKTLHLGAVEVGIARLNPAWIYSHVGRGPEKWGSKIDNNHKYVICFSVEMDYYKINEAPRVGTTEETALQYLNGQRISISLAEFIRSLGYPARAHISGSNYQIILPPAAYDAGIGELGRMGYIISPRFGGRIRLGAVTTNLPLLTDKPVNFGVQDFCMSCKKCAVNCPSGSIPEGEKTNVRGVEKWQINMESCYKYWRIIGTDCNICMKTCPYSHPDTFPHKILRLAIKNSSVARKLAIIGDDIFYGKKDITFKQ